MRSIRFSEYGGPEVLRVVEVDAPHAGPGQVRVRVRAAGVNQIDVKLRAGLMKDLMPLELPSGVGLDAAGVVDEVGEGVVGVSPGDRVFGSGSDTYSEHAVLTAWATVPRGLSDEEAAGYPVPVETAIRVLRQVGARPGQTLLVSGASGGVGSAVVQIAVDRGLTVLGTAGPDNQEHVRGMGAIPTTYGDGLVDRVRELAPDGVDAALDLAGSGVIADLVRLTGDPRRVLSIADFSAPGHGAQVSGQPEDPVAAYAEAARLFALGRLRIPVSASFPLGQAAEAHRRSGTGHTRGRLVLTVDQAGRSG